MRVKFTVKIKKKKNIVYKSEILFVLQRTRKKENKRKMSFLIRNEFNAGVTCWL